MNIFFLVFNLLDIIIFKILCFVLQRSDIVQGNYEPTEEECDFPSDDEDDVKDLSTDMEGKVKIEDKP